MLLFLFFVCFLSVLFFCVCVFYVCHIPCKKGFFSIKGEVIKNKEVIRSYNS